MPPLIDATAAAENLVLIALSLSRHRLEPLYSSCDLSLGCVACVRAFMVVWPWVWPGIAILVLVKAVLFFALFVVNLTQLLR